MRFCSVGVSSLSKLYSYRYRSTNFRMNSLLPVSRKVWICRKISQKCHGLNVLIGQRKKKKSQRPEIGSVKLESRLKKENRLWRHSHLTYHKYKDIQLVITVMCPFRNMTLMIGMTVSLCEQYSSLVGLMGVIFRGQKSSPCQSCLYPKQFSKKGLYYPIALLQAFLAVSSPLNMWSNETYKNKKFIHQKNFLNTA